ncbi:MAG: hypothetical protein E3J56_09795 [Candidatus Aminicenantes bacterium]|nr:MAG: hypothetical protein E3J56_09795 [Candidatus Aminicenantes bacterium]
MKRDKDMLLNIKKKLKELLPFEKVSFQAEPQIGQFRPDFIASIYLKNEHFKLLGEIIEKDSSSLFRKSISQLKYFVNQEPKYVPILISNYFSPKKQEYCKKNEINFLDLSGNVYLKYNNIYIEKIGFANQYQERRKGRNPFSDKASFMLRLMLKEDKIWGVRELGEKVGIDAGYVSRMFRELEKLNYLVRKSGKGELIHRKELIDDWVKLYDYRKNIENKYFCLAKGPEELFEKLKNLKIPNEVEYALGYHAGAHLISRHAIFNEVHVYVSNKISFNFFVKEMKLKRVDRGANVILLFPYYKHSVFFNRQKIRNLWIVSDVQLYLDLYKYPLRGLEQAEHLYEKRLKKLIEAN